MPTIISVQFNEKSHNVAAPADAPKARAAERQRYVQKIKQLVNMLNILGDTILNY
jgi:hypothetical protein